MTVTHTVRVHRSEENLPREQQLAHKIAKVATDPVEVTPEVQEMVINRILDNTAVAIASLTRGPIVSARDQALTHAPGPGGSGAALIGVDAATCRVSPEWAAWANGVAVRSWTTTTPSCPPSTPTPGTTSRRSSRWPSMPGARAGT